MAGNGNEVFVEEREGGYVALLNGQVICHGTTQDECSERAHNLKPYATIFGERVRNTEAGGRDQWRVLYHPKHEAQ